MPEMHLKRFTYSAGEPFAKNKERIQKLKETGDTGFKDLKRRTFSDQFLRNKAFNIAKNPKYDGYQREVATMVYKFFGKSSKVSGVNPIQDGLFKGCSRMEGGSAFCPPP